MENISIHLILLVLLIVVGPTIHKKVMGIQQNGYISMPNSDTDQSSTEEDKQQCDYILTVQSLKSLISYVAQSSSIRENSLLQFILPENIVLPPPKFQSTTF